MPSINSPQEAPGTNVPPAAEFYDPRVLTNPWPDPRWALHNMAAGDGQATQSPNDDLSNKGDSSPRTGPPDFWSKVDQLETRMQHMEELTHQMSQYISRLLSEVGQLQSAMASKVAPTDPHMDYDSWLQAMQEAMANNPHLYGMGASRQGLAPIPGAMANPFSQNPFTERP